MYSKDHPDEFKYTKFQEPPPLIFKLWMDKLSGAAMKEFGKSPELYLRKYYGFKR